MAQYGGFFNSGTTEETKKKYQDLDFARMLSLITCSQGYVPGYGAELLVAQVGQTMEVNIGSGAAWVGEPAGWWFINDSDSYFLQIESEESGFERIDRVVLRLDRNTQELKISAEVIKGNKDASNPQVPQLTQQDLKTDHIYDMPLATVHVTGESSSLTITDERIPCINSQSETIEKTSSWTLELTNMHKFIRVNSTSEISVTIPLNSDVEFPINTEIVFVQHGAGTVEMNAATGVTIYNSSGLKSSGQYTGFTLRKVGTDEWYALGSLTF